MGGAFDLGGEIPQFDDPRVRFFKGWFEDTLSEYGPPRHDVLRGLSYRAGMAMTKFAYALAGWACTVTEMVAGVVAVIAGLGHVRWASRTRRR